MGRSRLDASHPSKKLSDQPRRGGVSATLYWQIAAIIAVSWAVWVADRWSKHHVRGRIFVSAIGMSLFIPALFGVGNSPNLGSLTLAILSLILFGIGGDCLIATTCQSFAKSFGQNSEPPLTE